jgi:GT2 family glycosyltransferase
MISTLSEKLDSNLLDSPHEISLDVTPRSASVVISTYSEERWGPLVEAVHSLRAQTRPPKEVVVVVDHNPDLLTRVRRELDDVIVVENRGPRGLSGARNAGLRVSRGEVVAFLDDDAAAEPDWLDALLAAYSDPRVGAVGGRVEARWEAERPAWFPQEFEWVVGCSYRGLPTTASPVRNLIGANMSFRRDLLQATGGFHTSIGRLGTKPLGCEETELCIRAASVRPGTIIVYEPRARVRHAVPESRGRWAYFRKRCYAEGRSKAIVTALVGAGDGLRSERTYTLRTLPTGFMRAIGDAVSHRDPAALRRGLAIVAGLLWTTLGYGVGRVTESGHSSRRPRTA